MSHKPKLHEQMARLDRNRAQSQQRKNSRPPLTPSQTDRLVPPVGAVKRPHK